MRRRIATAASSCHLKRPRSNSGAFSFSFSQHLYFKTPCCPAVAKPSASGSGQLSGSCTVRQPLLVQLSGPRFSSKIALPRNFRASLQQLLTSASAFHRPRAPASTCSHAAFFKQIVLLGALGHLFALVLFATRSCLRPGVLTCPLVRHHVFITNRITCHKHLDLLFY